MNVWFRRAKKKLTETGVSFGAITLRVSPDPGKPLVRSRRFKIRLTPVIQEGKEHIEYLPCGCVFSRTRGPDKLKHYEIELRDARLLWRFDRDLALALEGVTALEFWTKEFVGEEWTKHWIHWVYPRTTWEKTGYGRWVGRSYDSHGLVVDDVPDGMPIRSAGFFKTTAPPPA